MDDWGWEHLEPWRQHLATLPVGPFLCVIDGPTRGRGWSPTAARAELRRCAATRAFAGGSRRISSAMRTRSSWHTKACRCR